MRIPWLLTLALALTTTASQADTRAYEDQQLARYQRYAGEPIDEFPMWRLDHWQVVGPDKIVIFTTLQDAYLVKVTAPCPQLEFAGGLSITSTVQRVTRKFDHVVFDHQRCPIGEMRAIDYRRLRADEKAAVKTEPAKS